jgi:hypothetical protein
MFNVPVGLTLPEQIKGITGGINLEQFRAHHIGIDLTPIEKSAWHSMLFGLVEYPPLNTTPKPRESQQDEYGLTVKRLAVRFNNTQLDRFDCRIELKLGKLFRETSVTDDGDTIELVGTYESRVKDGQAIETYTFKAKKTYTFN